MLNTTFMEVAVKTISASDANRYFSSLLRRVNAGEELTIVSRGKPVAVLSPVDKNLGARHKAKTRLLTRLKTQTPTGSRQWQRDDLYED